MSDAAKPLPEIYREWIERSIDEVGIEISHGLVLSTDGSMTVIALALPVPEAYTYMLGYWAKERPEEMIFAFDRFTKPGQGTTLGDVMAGHHFTPTGSRPFIVEYQHAPRIVKEVEWSNSFWNDGLKRELSGAISSLLAPRQ